MYDLHIHTSHSSDGQYTPEEILHMALGSKLKGLAFTDHMDISAAAEGMRLAASYHLSFFTGTEISTVFSHREYHLLIYGFHTDDEPLKNFLDHHCSGHLG